MDASRYRDQFTIGICDLSSIPANDIDEYICQRVNEARDNLLSCMPAGSVAVAHTQENPITLGYEVSIIGHLPSTVILREFATDHEGDTMMPVDYDVGVSTAHHLINMDYNMEQNASLEDHIIREDLPQLPEVFPTPSDVHEQLMLAVRECLGENVLRNINNTLEPILGDSGQIFNHSIFYRDVGGLDGSLDLLRGVMPIQQFIGRILYDDTVMSRFIRDTNNCIVNEASMGNTRVDRSEDNQAIVVHHTMPYSPVVERYISLVCRGNDCVNLESSEDGSLLKVLWTIHATEDLSSLDNISMNMNSILTIYYKLLTRFPSCQSYLNALPGFLNS